jgi:hypothetical protein
MPEIIFITLIIASLLLIGIAWIFALRESRLTAIWIEQTGRRTFGPTPMTREEEHSDDSRAVSRR